MHIGITASSSPGFINLQKTLKSYSGDRKSYPRDRNSFDFL